MALITRCGGLQQDLLAQSRTNTMKLKALVRASCLHLLHVSVSLHAGGWTSKSLFVDCAPVLDAWQGTLAAGRSRAFLSRRPTLADNILCMCAVLTTCKASYRHVRIVLFQAAARRSQTSRRMHYSACMQSCAATFAGTRPML